MFPLVEMLAKSSELGEKAKENWFIGGLLKSMFLIASLFSTLISSILESLSIVANILESGENWRSFTSQLLVIVS